MSSALPAPVRILLAVVAVAAVVVCGLAFAWRAEGGRWYVVKTASMGQAAPVGTLLLTKPISMATVHVGDIITFHAPPTGAVYSHRVVATTAAGLRTRGDINGVTDPWVITRHDLIGRVAHRAWGLGWVLRGLPLLLLCVGLVLLVTAFVRDRWRAPLRLVGVAVSISFVTDVLRPWVGLQRLGETVVGGRPALRAVSTGILPVRVTARHGGHHARLVDGQVGDIIVGHTAHSGAYGVTASLSLSPWWWVVIVLVCLWPLIWSLCCGFVPVPPERSTGGSGPPEVLGVAPA